MAYVRFCYSEFVTDAGVELLGNMQALRSLDLSGIIFLCRDNLVDSDPVIIPYKVVKRRFMPLSGIITGLLSAYFLRASYNEYILLFYNSLASNYITL